MSEHATPSDLPALETLHQLSRQIEHLRATHPELAMLVIDEVLRVVPAKRAILAGQLDGQPVILRLVAPDFCRALTREWAELQRISPHMADGAYRVATPVLHLPEAGAMITGRVPGPPLLEHLWHEAPALRARHLRPAAEWLRRYTETSESWGPGNAAGWLARAERAAATQPFARLRRIESGILDHLRALAGRLEGAEWRSAISHGDYHPNNLILGHDRLTGIDTGGSARLPVVKDIARFLVHMGRRGMCPSGRHRFGVDAQGIETFTEVFALTENERRLWLPFFFGVEALIRVETRALKPGRIRRAEEMYDRLLSDLDDTG